METKTIILFFFSLWYFNEGSTWVNTIIKDQFKKDGSEIPIVARIF
jgi:hypothetical protein